MRRRLVRHFALYLPSQVGPTIVGIVSIPILTRLLSASEFGLLTLALALVTGGGLLFQWLETALVRFYSAEGEDVAGWLRTAVWTHVALSILLCAAALAAARWWAPAGRGAFVVVGVGTFFVRNLYRFLTQILRARLEPGRFTSFVLWESAGGLLLGAALAYLLALGTEGVLAGYFLAGLAALPALWWRAIPSGALGGRFKLAPLRRMAGFGMPLAASQFGMWALRRIDRFQIQAAHGADAVGSYAVPYLVAQNSVLLFASTLRVLSLPLTSDVWERRGRAAGLRAVEAVTRLYLLGTIPMLAGISLLAHPVLQIMGGSEFGAGWTMIPWVAAGVFFLGLQQRFVNALMLVERTVVATGCIVAAALVNVALNWLLLPRFGYQVAAVTTFLSYALLAALSALACRRYVAWSFPWRSAWRAFSSAVGMVLVLLLLRKGLGISSAFADVAICVPVGVLAYAAFLRASGESDVAEWKAALSAALQRSARPPTTGESPSGDDAAVG